MPQSDPRAAFARALARLQAAQGWSDYALAKAIGNGRNAGLMRLKSGLRDPSLTTLVKLAEVLGVSLDELCGRDSP